jgi:hypothetical protein
LGGGVQVRIVISFKPDMFVNSLKTKCDSSGFYFKKAELIVVVPPELRVCGNS